jgi:gas vesicle protein
MEEKHHQGGSNGFLAGVIVGVVITLLFTTKKGREIFKETVDRAIDKSNNLQDKVETKLDEQEVFDDEEDGDDYIKPELPAPPAEPAKEVRYLANETREEIDDVEEEAPVERKHAEPKVAVEKEAPKKSSVRKFFKLKKS